MPAVNSSTPTLKAAETDPTDDYGYYRDKHKQKDCGEGSVRDSSPYVKHGGINMVKYIIRRFVEMVLTLFIIATATFFLLEAVPGDPLTQRADHLPQQSREALYARYGLDKPVMERYLTQMGNMLHGEFGESFVYAGQTVSGLLHDRLPVSARLGIQQMLLGVIVGLLLGILAAVKRGTIADYLVVGLSVLLISIPHLVLGLLLQKVFAGELHWFPTIGWPSGKDLWLGGWEYTVLPTLTGCFSYVATYARLLKSSMLDVVNQDYVLTAESKGLSRGRSHTEAYPEKLLYSCHDPASYVCGHVYYRFLLYRKYFLHPGDRPVLRDCGK